MISLIFFSINFLSVITDISFRTISARLITLY